MNKYKDNLFAVAFNICKNAADADDVVQDTFIQYHCDDKEFVDEEHIKAWLIRVAMNKSINVTRSFWRRRIVPIDDYAQTLEFPTQEAENLFDEVMKLPQKYRIALHLRYFEDYPVKQVAEILEISESNAKIRLARGRKMLEGALKEEWRDE